MIYDIFENRCQADPVFDVDYGELVRGPKGDPGNPGAPGAPGAAGVSPSVSVAEITGGHRVTITDATGTRSFDVPDGADGEPGEPGSPGAAGVSPSVSVAEITGGHRVTITDAAGTRSFDVMNGEPGAPGVPGQPGQDGRTPVKGEDYFTSTEISAIESEVLASAVPRPSGAPSVGKILKVLSVNDDGTFTCEWADAPSGAVEDVQINGSSILSDGVANIPIASEAALGLVKSYREWTGFGIRVNPYGYLYIAGASDGNISNRDSWYNPIVPKKLDLAVKAAMCDGVGEAWTSAEQLAARQRLGAEKTLLGSYTLSEDMSICDFSLPSGYTLNELSIFVYNKTGIASTGSQNELVFCNGNEQKGVSYYPGNKNRVYIHVEAFNTMFFSETYFHNYGFGETQLIPNITWAMNSNTEVNKLRFKNLKANTIVEIYGR